MYKVTTITRPIGVATYTLTNQLPQKYWNLLPNGKEISDKINKYFGEN
jgi:hypothetical protein